MDAIQEIPARVKWGRQLVNEFQGDLERLGASPGPVIPHTPISLRRGPVPMHRKRAYAAPVVSEKPTEDRLKVGIIGAGCAGLYTAMLLDWLNIDYEILEASDRNGGRIHTFRFPAPKEPGSEWAYFDLGAMRFPYIPIMWRTFDLFKRLGLGDPGAGLKEGDKLVPYKMNSDNQILYFNGVRKIYKKTEEQVKSEPVSAQFFKVNAASGGTVPDGRFATEDVSQLSEDAFRPFRQALTDDWSKGLEMLMRYDNHSARSFMATDFRNQSADESVNKAGYPNSVINWCETMEMGTGMYDNALSEMVIDTMEFDWPGAKYEGGVEPDQKDVNWFCLAGGSEVFIEKMVEKIKHKPELEKRVTHIRPTDDVGTLSVTVQGEQSPRTYQQVISSIPLSALRLVDTTKCNLTYAQNEAIRSLRYDSSVKIGLWFKYRWWQDEKFVKTGAIKGGKSNTDRISRCIVYPSYGIDDPDAAGVLLASYTWSQDAQRLGALCRGHRSASEEFLVDQLLQDLAIVHDVSFEDLKALLKDYKCWDWYDDPYAIGAFALFGPSQFKNMYPHITHPAAGGRLHFVGEATSVQHAWVVGALDSAMRGVIEMLAAEKRLDDAERLIKAWGPVWGVDLELLRKQALYGAMLTSGAKKFTSV